MKERLGWVSNSSSSSFLLLGKKVDYETAKYEKENNNTKIVFVGFNLCDGRDMIEDITLDQLKKLEWYNYDNAREAFEYFIPFLFQKSKDDGATERISINVDFVKKSLEEFQYPKLDVTCIFKDYNSTKTEEEFNDRYMRC